MEDEDKLDRIKNEIKNYPDFPKPGVLFRDVLPIFQHPQLLQDLISMMASHISKVIEKVDIIAAIESRGFLFAVPLSLQLKLPFVPLRKKGKLPGDLERVSFTLEYGVDTLEVQRSAIKKDQKVVIIDDLLATGGTMRAACQLVEAAGGKVAECFVVVELTDLKGKAQIKAPLQALIQY